MADSNEACIVSVNLADLGTISASSSILLSPPSTLQTPDVTERWRSAEAGQGNFIEYISSSFDTIAVEGTTMSATGQARVRVSSTDSSGVAGDIEDTGWFVVDGGYNRLVVLLTSVATSGYVRVDLSDPGEDYVEAGRLVVGERTQFTVNFQYGWGSGYVSRSIINKTAAGLTKIWRRSKVRTLDVTFSFLSESERHGLVETIDRDNGVEDDILFIVDPTSSKLERDSIWGLATTLSQVTQPYPEIFVKQYQIEQRL